MYIMENQKSISGIVRVFQFGTLRRRWEKVYQYFYNHSGAETRWYAKNLTLLERGDGVVQIIISPGYVGVAPDALFGMRRMKARRHVHERVRRCTRRDLCRSVRKQVSGSFGENIIIQLFSDRSARD